MNITNRTVLITGGGSGIGFETAKLLSQNNKVLIIGRNENKIKDAAAVLENTEAIVCDITNEADIDRLLSTIKQTYPDLSILINNAGTAYVYEISGSADAYTKAKEEIDVNYLSLIRLTEKLLPILKNQPDAAIVNVSSVVAFSPLAIIPSYSASKAAVHSYTLALRHVLAKNSTIRVFELMQPTVNTEFAKEIGGEEHGMPPAQVASDLIAGLENDTYEVYTGITKDFRDLFFSSPKDAFEMMNKA
jgi:uncharacterized oxidoreductase